MRKEEKENVLMVFQGENYVVRPTMNHGAKINGDLDIFSSFLLVTS